MKVFKYILPFFTVVLFSCEGRGGCEVNDVDVEISNGTVTATAEVEHSDLIEQYNWEFSDGFQAATLVPTIEHSIATPGDHKVYLEAELSNGNFCELEESFHIGIIENSKDSCDIDIVTLDLKGNELAVEVEIQGDENQAVFWWDFGDGNQLNNSTFNSENVYGEIGAFKLKVGYEGGNGCRDSTQRIIYIDSLTAIDESCSVDFDVTPIINGKTVSLIVVSKNVSGNQTYTWNMGDSKPGLTTSVSNYIYSYSSPGIYDVEVTMIDGNCTDTEKIQVYIP